MSKQVLTNEDAEKTCPYLVDLVDLHNQAARFPFALSQLQLVDMRIKLANEWRRKCSDAFLKPESLLQQQPVPAPADPQINGALVEALTPRVDLHHQIQKLENLMRPYAHLLAIQESSSAGAAQMSTRRARKHFASALSASSTCVDYIVNVDSLAELYAHERDADELRPKYRLLEAKEMEMAKVLRKLNLERLRLAALYLRTEAAAAAEKSAAAAAALAAPPAAAAATPTSELPGSSNGGSDVQAMAVEEAEASPGKPAEQPTAPVTPTGATTTNPTTTTPVAAATAAAATMTPLTNVRCCACSKSMLYAISTKQFVQCLLCQGLFHGQLHILFFL